MQLPLVAFLIAAVTGICFLILTGRKKKISLEDLAQPRKWNQIWVLHQEPIDTSLISEDLELHYSQQLGVNYNEHIRVFSHKKEGEINAYFLSGKIVDASVNGVHHSTRHCEWARDLLKTVHQYSSFKVSNVRDMAS